MLTGIFALAGAEKKKKKEGKRHTTRLSANQQRVSRCKRDELYDCFVTFIMSAKELGEEELRKRLKERSIRVTVLRPLLVEVIDLTVTECCCLVPV